MDRLIVGMIEQENGTIQLVWESDKTQLDYARDIRSAMLRGNFDEAKRIAAISRMSVDLQRKRESSS